MSPLRKPLERRVLAIGLSFVLSACGPEAPSAEERAFTEGFVRSCLPMCERVVPDRECPALCECRLREMHEGDATNELVAFVNAELARGGGGPTEAILERIDRADLRCGGALLRAGFVDHCVGACRGGALTQSACRRACECSFERIRQHPSREGADAFYAEHLAGREADAEGTSALERVTAACMVDVGGVPAATAPTTEE